MRNLTNESRLYYTFSFFGSIMLPSGVGLVCFSLYSVYRNLYPVFFWEKTTGMLTGTVQQYDNSGEFYVYEKASYHDKEWKPFEIVSGTSAGTTDGNIPSTGEVTIYYNPRNSQQAMIFMWRNFLPILMLPFGFLLIFLGWPLEKSYRKSLGQCTCLSSASKGNI